MFTTTILSTLIGIFGSAIPDVISIFKSRQDTINEVKLLEAKTEYNKIASQLKIDELNTQADISETESIHDSDAALDGGKFVNAFRAIIRPFITVVFFITFMAIKAYAVYYGTHVQGLDIINMLPIIWDDETSAIFGAVMGFWFGNRNIEKYYARKNNNKTS
jgi:hypothetical protein